MDIRPSVHACAYSILGRCLARQQNFAKAAEAFEQSVQIAHQVRTTFPSPAHAALQREGSRRCRSLYAPKLQYGYKLLELFALRDLKQWVVQVCLTSVLKAVPKALPDCSQPPTRWGAGRRGLRSSDGSTGDRVADAQ